MNRPDLFISGNQSFSDGIHDIASSTKRIADHLAPDAPTSKRPCATRRVIYLCTNYSGITSGPSYGRFFSHFPNSPEGREAKKLRESHASPVPSRDTTITALHLTWLLNQPSATLLSASHTGQCSVWTVAVDEPTDPG